MDIKKRFDQLDGYAVPGIDFSYLNDLAEAIIRVEEPYCEWKYKGKTQQIERVFCYEMYHQLRNLTQSNVKYDRISIAGEITKLFGPNYAFENFNIAGAPRSENLRYTPDLTVHFSQENKEEENQKLIVEVKTNKVTAPELIGAILKLNHYLEHLNFQLAVFISVNTKRNDLKNSLMTHFASALNEKNNFDKIIVMNYKDRKLDVLPLSFILAQPSSTT